MLVKAKSKKEIDSYMKRFPKDSQIKSQTVPQFDFEYTSKGGLVREVETFYLESRVIAQIRKSSTDQDVYIDLEEEPKIDD